MSEHRRHILLVEIAHLRRVLLENRLDFLKQKYLPLLADALKQGKLFVPLDMNLEEINKSDEYLAQEIFDETVKSDPDLHKKNTQWMLNVLLSGNSQVEDLYKANEYLQIYDRVKRLLPVEQRDLNKYKSFSQLYDVIEPIAAQETQREMDRKLDAEMHSSSNARVVYNSDAYKIIVPLTKEAACYFGRNTQWCTAAKYHNYFDSYNSQGPLYIILDKKNNRRWQFHEATQQFADERDNMIDARTWVMSHPEAAKALDSTLPPPVATVAVKGREAVVYRSPRGLEIKSEASLLLSKTLAFITLDNEGRCISIDNRLFSNFTTDEMVKLFNDLHLDAVSDVGSRYGIWLRDGKWKTTKDAAKPFMKFSSGWYWGTIKVDYGAKYFLFPPSKTPSLKSGQLTMHRAIEQTQGSDEGYAVAMTLKAYGILELNSTPIADRNQRDYKNLTGAISSYVVDLVLRLDIKEWYDNGFQIDSFSEKDAKRLVDKRPYLANLASLYKAQGVTPLLKRKIVKILKENDIPFEDQWFRKDDLVVQKWDNIEDCMDDIGTEDGKRFFKYYLKDGGEFESWTPDIDEYMIRDFLSHTKKVDPKLFGKIGPYLEERYEIEEEFGDDFDPNDVKDLASIIKEVDDDDLMNCVRDGVETGNLYGAEHEALKIFKREIKRVSPYLWFQSPNKRWGNELVWDVPVILVVPIKALVNILGEREPSLYEGWAERLEVKLNPEEPYGGMTDYDDNAANEVFVERLSELLD